MKITPFQAIVLVIFGAALVAGIIILATTQSGGKKNNLPVVIWGTISDDHFRNAVEDITEGNSGYKITYIEKRSENFDQELVEALASGVGPDAILFPHDLIMRHRDKILFLPYSSLPARTFKDTFIQEGELYLDSGGIIALPFSLDPLVMYWNRDLLIKGGYALPPKSWDEFITMVPKLTVKDINLNILKSGVALGEFRNIANAKEIIAAFLMQTGNPITVYGEKGFDSRLYPATLGSIGAINFYTDFANPVKPDYSWNRALPNSLNMFVSGDLAFYFGFASEISMIRDKNPNLNFDVTFFPQPKGASVPVTFGRMYGLAVLKSSRNSSGAFQAIMAITGRGPIGRLNQVSGLPPVRRDMLNTNPSDPYQSIFYNSAIRARGWLDPNPVASKTIFQNMIESVTGGELEAGRAIETAGKSLQGLFRRF
ncbi:MAG: Extracellular solute-binding protein family 1 [Parcubacteria group bacterium GW2011_GWA2_44_15]|nr:MAG: Extracellular solute-binding protein family 1 [Parcubacteria group bacterium GW2011_GWA2_44_15]